MGSLADRALRRLVPSTARLSQSRLFGMAHRVLELAPRAAIRLFSDAPLPPGRLIVRIGVGNTVLRTHYWYLTSGYSFWLYAIGSGYVRLDSTVVDIGCGVGRMAVPLRDHRYRDSRFTGHYYGFDVDREMISWCRQGFPPEHFTFQHIDTRSGLYNSAGSGHPAPLSVPGGDGVVDFVCSHSLLTHLLEEDVRHNLQESHRLLRPGGVMVMTFFCLEDLAEGGFLGGRWTFRHRMGAARVESLRIPEAAVAYERQWMLDLCRECGFSEARTELPDFQTTLVAVK